MTAENMMNKIYTQIFAWEKKDDNTAVRYCCFQGTATEKYAVQSADFFRLHKDDLQHEYFDNQIVELFIESEPSERCSWHDGLPEAIAAHKREFF